MSPVLFECRLCGQDCGTRAELRIHLHIDHLKSDIIDAYLETVDG